MSGQRLPLSAERTILSAMVIVGRDAVRAELADRLRRAGRGTGSVVLVAGEAGIGKTTLCEDVLDQADGWRRAWAGCWQADAPALWPWSRLLARLSDDAVLESAPTRSAQFAAVVRALRDDRPTLLVLDDVHWADPASLSLLTHVAAEVRALPVLVLATYRPDDTGPALAAELPAQRG
ncbi:MAG TPA: ATP-binding protein, partial [Actinokineospora sp.]|nr:ATP-binding protein [Actinokineospora sp.]